MDRREALNLLAMGSAGLALSPWNSLYGMNIDLTSAEIKEQFDRLRKEPSLDVRVKTERGAPRMFVNDKDVYPLLAWSYALEETTPSFKRAGINMLHPFVSIDAFWPAPGKYDFSKFDAFMAALLKQNPEAYILPRVFLYAPKWWRNTHPDQAAKFELKYNPDKHSSGVTGEGGFELDPWLDYDQPSYASELWRKDTADAFRAFIHHVEHSPLQKRVLGYHFCYGVSHEWHYLHADLLPDTSEPMRKAIGYIPTEKERLDNTYGLLRDPEKEEKTIEFYRRFHDLISDTVIYFAKVVKEATEGRKLAGVFFLYLLENIWIQEGGHLSPKKILECEDLDFIASPYTYERTNIKGLRSWDSDVLDDGGNWLGRARGVGGDGAYRVLVDSIKRHGKLFVSEMDPCTYLEKAVSGSNARSNGGSGSDTEIGTLRILQRDLGQMYTSGCAGWFLDFGPIKAWGNAGAPWYESKPIEHQIRQFAELGKHRKDLDLSPIAEMAAVYDAKSFFVTQHWLDARPFPKGAHFMDTFDQDFLDAQNRTFHRIGAPLDYFYRDDLAKDDLKRHKLYLMVNVFYLDQEEVERLRSLLKNSGVTVLWYYAPGFVGSKKLSLEQMESLTGFKFKVIDEPGPMMIRCYIEEPNLLINKQFGMLRKQFPRFAVDDPDARTLGYWTDHKGVAFAMKEHDGWQSVYVGAAPVPVEILRWLAQKAGVKLWSDRPDVVYGTRDTAMIVATESGSRTFSLPGEMVSMDGKHRGKDIHLNLDFGEVRVFSKKV